MNYYKCEFKSYLDCGVETRFLTAGSKQELKELIQHYIEIDPHTPHSTENFVLRVDTQYDSIESLPD